MYSKCEEFFKYGDARIMAISTYFEHFQGPQNYIGACVCPPFPSGHLVFHLDTVKAREIEFEMLEDNVALVIRLFECRAPQLDSGVKKARDDKIAPRLHRKKAFANSERELEVEVVVMRNPDNNYILEAMSMADYNRLHRANALRRQRAWQRKRANQHRESDTRSWPELKPQQTDPSNEGVYF